MAAVEQFANLNVSLGQAQTSINQGGGIGSGDTSMTVGGHTGFPSVAQYRCLIENELILVTGGAGTNTWTIQRGIEGTTAAAHANSTLVTHILTAGGLEGVCGQTVLSDVYANLPSAGTVGKLYLPTDGYALQRDGGSAWSLFGPMWPLTLPPALGSWTQVNGTGATFSTLAGAINILANANSSNDRKILAMAAPATPYTITALLVPDIYAQQFNAIGVGWRDSSTDHQAFICFNDGGSSTAGGAQGEIELRSVNSLSSTGFYSGYVTLVASTVPAFIWLRIRDDGTNRIVSYSHDGLFFRQIHSIARTTDVANPNQVMFFAESINATYQAAVTLLSWAVTS